MSGDVIEPEGGKEDRGEFPGRVRVATERGEPDARYHGHGMDNRGESE
jgi:hypothetical protein